MRIQLLAPAVLAIVLSACGGATTGSTPIAAPSAGGGAVPTAQSPATTGSTPGGSVDCASIKTAASQLLMIQFLAQLNTPEIIEQIKGKQIGSLDVDAFLASMHELHALDSFASPLGDPKAAIEFYEKAGNAAKVLFAIEPITQTAIDTYNANVGTISDFLGHQIAITGALDAAGC